MARQTAEKAKEPDKPLTPEEIEAIKAKIALTGNLAGMSDAARWLYYQWYCSYLDLDPITRPFDIITTYETGPNSEKVEKTILYANASCAAQLANKRHVTYSRPETEYDSDLQTVTIHVKAEFALADVPRSCWRRGVAHVNGLKGRWLENAIKKAETQAHRRATLALCGVAMSDESEVEDIAGAEISALVPTGFDASTDVDEIIGTYLVAAGIENNSGSRAYVRDGLRTGAYQAVANYLKTPIDVALSIERKRKASGDPGAPLYTEDDKIQIRAELESAGQKIETARQEETAIKEEAREARQEDQAEKTENAVAGLVVTLSETHQKVSDTFGLIIRDYKRVKPDVLAMISKFLGRQINRAADLDEAEAVRALKWLDAWVAKLKKNVKASPSWEFDQHYRNHDDANAERLNDVYARLTSLNMPGQKMLDKMQEILVRIGAPVTSTRYAIDDEAAVSVCEIFEEWADDLEKDKAS